MTDKRKRSAKDPSPNLNAPISHLLGDCRVLNKCVCGLCPQIWLEYLQGKFKDGGEEMPVTNQVLMVKVAEVANDLAQLQKILARLSEHVGGLQNSIIRKGAEEN